MRDNRQYPPGLSPRRHGRFHPVVPTGRQATGWQVSWLMDQPPLRRLPKPSLAAVQWICRQVSPYTVAGTAADYALKAVPRSLLALTPCESTIRLQPILHALLPRKVKLRGTPDAHALTLR